MVCSRCKMVVENELIKFVVIQKQYSSAAGVQRNAEKCNYLSIS